MSLTFCFGKSNKKASKQWDYFKAKIKHEISTAITKKVQNELKSGKVKGDKSVATFRIERKMWEKENEKIIKYISGNLTKDVPKKNFNLMVEAQDDYHKRSLDFYRSYKTEENVSGKKVKVAKFRLDLVKEKFDYYLRFIKNDMKKKKFKVKKVNIHSNK
jgi:hypothetical protein